ncbi:hypothetical protein RHMOL_Rhmol04G0131600 [Rhododendron molle]|uniref:Uncharacterized protein n=1 Tax=Rhododendron molle TaxID=49168 RepID=A0ACC0P2D8_RHOML|nr:hypothetical protein RHMOL_Rhmol04G0131600 [Rhododendron molle]
MVDAPMLLRQVREDDDVDKGGKDMDASKDQPKEDMADAEYDVEHEVEQGVGINDDHIQRPKASHLWKALPNTKTSMAAATIIIPVENIQNSLLPKSADVLAPNAGVINIVSNSITSSHNLDSFVQDSNSPSTNKFSKSEISSAKAEDEEAHFSNLLDQLLPNSDWI